MSDLLQSESDQASLGTGEGEGLQRGIICFTDMNTELEVLGAFPFIARTQQLSDEQRAGEPVC